MVAISANSPYLFGKDLWDETRIPLFEQSVEIGGPGKRRVCFGYGYLQQSLMECFAENLAEYPALLPLVDECPTGETGPPEVPQWHYLALEPAPDRL